jgi:hypothetical protein
VKNFLSNIKPMLKIKRRQANLVLKRIDEIQKIKDVETFIKLCHRVDQIAELNDSKKRVINAFFVKNELLIKPKNIEFF